MEVAVSRWVDGHGSPRGDPIGPNPTDRGKAGTKRSILVDGDGGPLGVVVAGANVNDFKLLRSTIESMVVGRPESEQHLCLDKRGTTTRPAGKPPPHTATFRISDALGRRSLTGREERFFPPAGGSWSARLHGSQSAAPCSSGTRRRWPTTLGSYNSHVCSYGSGATTG